MIKLIEDYKNYRKAKARFDIALDDLYEQYKSMVVYVSVEECVENITVSKMFFERWLPKDSGEPNHREKFVAAFEGGIKFFRLPYCFYQLNSKSSCKIVSDEGVIDFDYKTIGRCVCNYKSEEIFEGCCDGCPNSFEMTKYRLLALFVEAAEEKREDAKKRLMSHFWRQKNVQK